MCATKGLFTWIIDAMSIHTHSHEGKCLDIDVTCIHSDGRCFEYERLVCAYVCTHRLVCAYVCTHRLVCLYVCTQGLFVRTCVRKACVCTCIGLYVPMRTQFYVYTRTHTQAYAYTFMHTNLCIHTTQAYAQT